MVMESRAVAINREMEGNKTAPKDVFFFFRGAHCYWI